MPALDVLPLADAKVYLNIPSNVTTNDTELTEDFIPPAVERVERHIYGSDAGGVPLTHLDPATVTPSQRLACKVVLGEYWRTQRGSFGARTGGAVGRTGIAIMADSDPSGHAPLRTRLTELLGEPVHDPVDRGVPVGSFPDAQPLPDQAWPDRAFTYRTL